MRGVDHNPVGFAGFARQLGEDAVEHPQAAPADEAVVDGLVRTVTLGGIAPHQTVFDDVNNARHDPLVIDPGNAVRQWKKRLDPAHLRLAQQERNIHRQRLLDAAIELTNHGARKHLIGPEPCYLSALILFKA